MKSNVISLIIIYFSLQSAVIAQQRIDKIIDNYTNVHPVEQVYLHVDNAMYSANDTVWFKAYVLENALPSAFSNNLYVD